MNFDNKCNEIKTILKQEISSIEDKILSAINVREQLESHLKEFLSTPSKRIRSLLTILYLKSLGFEITDNQLEILCAVELVHNASLIHDDIIDECDTRRGRKTISFEFGNKLGVLSGDYLLSCAMNKIAQLNSPEIIKIFSETLQKMCIGEINQNFDKYKIGTIEQYIEKSKNKTAYLFKTALISCLISSKADSEIIKSASEFGINFGIAFQIRDDLLNLTQNDPSKPSKNDIDEGIYNSAVIYAGNSQNYSDGIEKTVSLLDNYIVKSKNIINDFNHNQYTCLLIELLEYLSNE